MKIDLNLNEFGACDYKFDIDDGSNITCKAIIK
jgi:hypothetical protein